MGRSEEIVGKSTAEEVEWASYLKRWIFKRRCPVCCGDLNSRHAVAHIGSCNFNGPNLSNGFLSDVKNGRWEEIVQPFSRLTSMDLMACEVVRCPRGAAVVVWVEVDLVMGGDQYLIYTERIGEYEFSKIEQATSLTWVSF